MPTTPKSAVEALRAEARPYSRASPFAPDAVAGCPYAIRVLTTTIRCIVVAPTKILVEHPLRQIDQPPAYDPMDRRGRTGLDHCDERAPLLVIEFRGMPGRLAVDEAIRPPEIEPEDPIANGL